MRRALREYMISGVKTTINFHRQVIKHPDFVSGDYDTNFVRLKKHELMAYSDQEPERLRLPRLVAEISAKGYNPYVARQYRGRQAHGPLPAGEARRPPTPPLSRLTRMGATPS
jgi:pyruvate carboxylase